MLGRILIIMAVVGLGLWLLRKAMGSRTPPPTAPGSADRAKLIACAHCGARLPATEAVWKEGQSYCSMTHRNLGPKS